MGQRLYRIIMPVMTRSITVYLLIIAAALPLVNIQKIKAGFALRESQEAVSLFSYLLELEHSGAEVNQDKLKSLAGYYENIVEYFPQQADGYSLLAYCYFYLGKIDDAVFNFKKAIEINPEVLWFYYNLGQIYYDLEEYQEAAGWLEKAITTKPQATLSFIASSKEVYWPVIGNNENFSKLKVRLLEGYQLSYQWIIMSFVQQRNYPGIYNFADRAIKFNFDQHGFFSYWAAWALYQNGQAQNALPLLRNAKLKNEGFKSMDINLNNNGDLDHIFSHRDDFGKKVQAVFSPKEDKVKLRLF